MATRIEQLKTKRERLRLEIETTALELQREQIKRHMKKRHYEGAARTERTSKWKTPNGSGPNTILRPALRTLRERSRDTIRNNPLGESAASVIVSGIVGDGIEATIENKRLAAMWKQWSESTQCDATGISNFRGLQTLVARAWAENGEVLFRRVIRHDWKPGEIPFALQLLEPDYIDDSNGGFGGEYQLGVKVNEYGAPTAYRIFQRHPFENEITLPPRGMANTSIDVPVSEIGHMFLRRRVGQIRGTPPFAPVLIRMRDDDEFEDAHLVRQKLGACFMAFITNDGETPDDDEALVDMLTPGLVQRLKTGEAVQFASPPGVPGYGEYTSSIRHSVAAGIGIPYEEYTGDYSKVSWSSGRLARMKFYANLDVWQWEMFIPMFCEKVFGWFCEGAAMLGAPCRNVAVQWTAPRRPVADLNEYVRLRDEVRAGLKSIPEAIRENGFDPIQVADENSEYLAYLDTKKLVIDSDPRRISGFGQGQPYQQETGIPALTPGGESTDKP